MMMMTYQTSCELELTPSLDCTLRMEWFYNLIAFIPSFIFQGTSFLPRYLHIYMPISDIPSLPGPAAQSNKSTLSIISFNNDCSYGINFSYAN